MEKVAIIGSGSFGCALAYVISKNNKNIMIWSYTEEEKELINNNHECKFLPNFRLNEKIVCSNNYEEVIKDSSYIILVSPSSSFRKTCEDIKKYVTNQEIIIASKGLEKDILFTDIAKEVLNKNISLILGPSHAEQIIKEMPTFIEYYGNDKIKEIFETDTFKIIKNDDYIGMQISSAFKNVITLGYGILEGKGYESNTTSYFITKGLEEIKEIGINMGAKESTFYGLSGLGDLLATSIGMDSRNKRAGILLGKGEKIDEVKKEIGMTIEGIDSLLSAKYLIDKYNINSIIINKIYNFIYKNEELTI